METRNKLPDDATFRLHMGELTASELRTAKAAYGFALATLARQEPAYYGDPMRGFFVPAAHTKLLGFAPTIYSLPLYAAPVAERPAADLSALHEVIESMRSFSDAEMEPGWAEFDSWLGKLRQIDSQKERNNG